MLALAVAACTGETGNGADGWDDAGTDPGAAEDSGMDCRVVPESSTPSPNVKFRVENTTDEPVFVGGVVSSACPGYSLDAVGEYVGALPGTGDTACSDVQLFGSCPRFGNGWCPGFRRELVEPGQAYETTWDGRLYREVEVPACFGCDDAETCGLVVAAPAGPYRVRFGTFDSDDSVDGPTGALEVVFDHPMEADVVLRIQ